MDEQRLQTILGQKLEVPDMINQKLEETYAQLEGRRRPAKRRGVRPVRTALIAAALVAALCVTATAAYNYYIRQNVPVDEGQTVQGIVGGGQPSWDEEQVYDEHGKLEHSWYNRQTVPADPDQAMALLGDYLPECGYQWQIEDFTLTVEGYALDEHTGTAKFYYTVEHPGGFPEDAVDWQHGYLNYTANILYVTFESMSSTDSVLVRWANLCGRGALHPGKAVPGRQRGRHRRRLEGGGRRAHPIQHPGRGASAGRRREAHHLPGRPEGGG